MADLVTYYAFDFFVVRDGVDGDGAVSVGDMGRDNRTNTTKEYGLVFI